MHRKSAAVMIPLAGLIAWVAADAQQRGTVAEPTRLGIVNMTLLFEKLQMVKDLEAVFQQKQAEIREKADANAEEINRRQKELDSGAFAPDSEDYKEREDELLKLRIEREIWLRQRERNLKRDHKEWFEKVYRRVVEACEAIARETGVDVILADNPVDFSVSDSNALIAQILQKKVIHSSARVDLTADVLSRVDEFYRKQGGRPTLELAN